MTSGVITVSGTKYAAGLYWQPSPDANIAKAARQAAKQPGFQAEFFCVRPPSKSQPVGQFGLGIKAAGHRAGMSSIAACLVAQQLGSWAGTFRVPEGVYFVSVRDELIDPEGDVLFLHDTEAQARLEQEISRGGLTSIICPPEWGIQGSSSASITSILSGRKDIVLRPTAVSTREIVGLVVILALGGALYGGYTMWQQKVAEEEAARQAQEAAFQQSQLAKRPAAVYPKTWQDKPMPMSLLTACGHAMKKLAASYLGWSISDLQCSEGGLSVTWTRAPNSGVVPADDKANLDASLTTASVTIPLEGITPRGTEELAYYGLIDRAVILHNLPVHLGSLPDDAPPVVAAANSSNPPPPPPPPPKWRKRSATFDVKGSPWLRPDLFDIFPGLIITTVKQQGGNTGNFTVEGIIYENKQPQ